jgi:hypothetical protein
MNRYKQFLNKLLVDRKPTDMRGVLQIKGENIFSYNLSFADAEPSKISFPLIVQENELQSIAENLCKGVSEYIKQGKYLQQLEWSLQDIFYHGAGYSDFRDFSLEKPEVLLETSSLIPNHEENILNYHSSYQFQVANLYCPKVNRYGKLLDNNELSIEASLRNLDAYREMPQAITSMILFFALCCFITDRVPRAININFTNPYLLEKDILAVVNKKFSEKTVSLELSGDVKNFPELRDNDLTYREGSRRFLVRELRRCKFEFTVG